MKVQLAARVIGHKIFQPNPKDLPDIECAKVTLVLASMTKSTTKSTTATVHVDIDATNDEFALGRTVSLTFEDWQQVLDLDGRGKALVVDGERFDTKTGESLGPAVGMPANSTVTFLGAGMEPVTVTGPDLERAAKALGRGRKSTTLRH